MDTQDGIVLWSRRELTKGPRKPPELESLFRNNMLSSLDRQDGTLLWSNRKLTRGLRKPPEHEKLLRNNTLSATLPTFNGHTGWNITVEQNGTYRGAEEAP